VARSGPDDHAPPAFGDPVSADAPLSPAAVTRILQDVRRGDRSAVDRLFPLVYDELRRLAGGQLRRHAPSPTLQATALVHEAYLKLAGGEGLNASDRAHFLAIAARAMRQVLVDRARARGRLKRGGGMQQTTLSGNHGVPHVPLDDVLALDRALAELDPRQREVVEYRFFAGMEETEIAGVLGVSERTVRRDWVKARAWLVRALAASPDS
jgi:RNA polymerase sigma factor (TIGR02999 family)